MSKRLAICGGAVIGVAAWLASQAGAAVNSLQVEQAVQRATAFLYQSQNKDGHWEVVPLPKRTGKPTHAKLDSDQWGGLSSMSVYALLAAGENSQDPRIRKAVNFLREADIIGVYALGMRCQVWLLLGANPAIRTAMKRDADFLLHALKHKGDARGMYNYHHLPEDRYDHSVSQYGVLGMWALAQGGMEIGLGYWQEVERAWRAHQHPSGAWSYLWQPSAKHPANAPMTAAGIATLFITQDFLHSNEGVLCKGNVRDEHIERGLRWMSENFDDFRKKRSYYTLYGIERIGLASGYKYFGTVNWYQDGAEYLLQTQRPDGGWGDGVADTCFGIVFLVRGRAPIMINKLDYEIEVPQVAALRPTTRSAAAGGPATRPGLGPTTLVTANWNERPRDVANLTRWMSRMTERHLNWQVVNLRVSMDDLHDAPVLYISGNQELRLCPDDQAKLKLFIEQGGLILGHADCGSEAFSTSFTKLGMALFPRYEFRQLPADHPIYTQQQFPRAHWKSPPSVLGLSNGVRELMLLLDREDPARNWQTMAYGNRPELFQVAGDIFLYAVDKMGLRYRGETYVIAPDPRIQPARAMVVQRLEHGGNWDPEPGGWRRLAALLRNEQQIDLKLEPVKLGTGRLAAPGVAHLTAAGPLKLADDEVKELRQFVLKGGTLLVDAAGGSAATAAALEAELGRIVIGGRLEPMGLDHALLADVRIGPRPAPSTSPTTQPQGAVHIDYRRFARQRIGNTRDVRLRSMRWGKRCAIVYSDMDLSGGMVGQNMDGIAGYTPGTATEIMRRLVVNLAPK